MSNKYNIKLLPGLSICLFSSVLTGCNTTQKPSISSHTQTQQSSATSNENNGEDTSAETDKKRTDLHSVRTKKPEEIVEDVKDNCNTIKKTLVVSDEMFVYIRDCVSHIRSLNSRHNKDTQNKKIHEWLNKTKCKGFMKNYLDHLNKAQESNAMLLKDSTVIATGNDSDNLNLLIDESKVNFETIEKNDKEIQQLISCAN